MDKEDARSVDRLARRIARRDALHIGLGGAVAAELGLVPMAGAAACGLDGERCRNDGQCCGGLVCDKEGGARRCVSTSGRRGAPESAAVADGPMPVFDPEGPWRLAFRDEFEGVRVDWSRWNAQYPWGGSRMRCCDEEQYYNDRSGEGRSGNYWVHDGMLSLIARRERIDAEGHSHPFSSGLLQTRGKFNFTGGYIEVRARMPNEPGTWPAFWVLPVDSSGSRPEWDVLECYGDEPTRVSHCWHLPGQVDGCHTLSRIDVSRWHVYGFAWGADDAVWHVDGVETARRAGGFNMPSYLLLNLAVHERAGKPADGAYPASFDVDCVRAWSSVDRRD